MILSVIHSRCLWLWWLLMHHILLDLLLFDLGFLFFCLLLLALFFILFDPSLSIGFLFLFWNKDVIIKLWFNYLVLQNGFIKEFVVD
jgi:hypothetical protein